MNRVHILVAVLILAVVSYAYSSCMARREPPEPFTIAWNYDTNGFLETCGCSAHQLGGLARRATKLAALREKQPLLALEGAHFIEDAGEFQFFKGETIVSALNLMSYDALQLGIREAQHGPDGIAQISSTAEFPCFSCNLEVNGSQWEVPSVEIELAISSCLKALDSAIPAARCKAYCPNFATGPTL